MKPARKVDGNARGHLRPAPPLDDQSMSLCVGDLVVYASHGVGRVESTQPSDDLTAATPEQPGGENRHRRSMAGQAEPP